MDQLKLTAKAKEAFASLLGSQFDVILEKYPKLAEEISLKAAQIQEAKKFRRMSAAMKQGELFKRDREGNVSETVKSSFKQGGIFGRSGIFSLLAKNIFKKTFAPSASLEKDNTGVETPNSLNSASTPTPTPQDSKAKSLKEADLIKETAEPTLIKFDGFTDTGKKELEDFLPPLFKDIFKKIFEENKDLFSPQVEQEEQYSEGGLIGTLLDYLPFLGGRRGAARRRARRMRRSRAARARNTPTPSKPPTPPPTPAKPTPSKPPTPAKPTPPSNIPRGSRIPRAGGIGGILGGMLTFGGALAAGETLYGLGTEGREETVKKAQERYSDEYFDLGNIWEGISTLGLSTGMALIGGIEDLFKQSDENWVQEQKNKALEKTLKLQSDKKKAMITAGYKDMDSFDAFLYGYKDVEQFKKDRITGKLDPSKMQDWRQSLPDSKNTIKPQNKISSPINQPIQPSSPLSKLPTDIKPIDVEKPAIKLEEPKLLPLPQPKVIPAADQATDTLANLKIPEPIDNSQVLTEISSNTKTTNNSIQALSNAVFKLAQVFDKNGKTGGNNIIVNGQQQQQTPSASQVANSNVDPIRRIRAQFAV